MAERRDTRTLNGHQRLVPRRDRPVTRPGPVVDPRLSGTRSPAPNPSVVRAQRRAGLVLVAVAVFWIAVTWAGVALGWPTRLRALLDVFALAGFGFALYLTWQVWRTSRTHKG